MNQEYLSQILLAVVLMGCYFTFYYKFGFVISKIIGRRVCPVCFSVGSTWLTLILLKISGIYLTERHLISVLLAESVVGVSYLVEEFLLLYNIKIDDYLLKFGIIIYGTAAVLIHAFVNEWIGFIAFLPVIIFGFISLTPVKRRI